jgi:hypothetical protein
MFRIVSPFSRVQYILAYKNRTLENGPMFLNYPKYIEFRNKYFCGTVPSDPPNFIKL